MSLLQFPPPSLSSHTTHLKSNPKPKLIKLKSIPFTFPPKPIKKFPLITTTKNSLNQFLPINPIPHNNNNNNNSQKPLNSIKPFLQTQWKPILKGWICSAISVYSLSQIVPKIGQFSANFGRYDVVRLRDEGLWLCSLVLAKSVASYWQQAFLWEAALNSVYEIRVYVFDKVLKRDLGFFEGGGGVLAGDIAYRMTAEASDVADTVYALLNTIVPSTLQLSAMAAQMLVISPILSLLSALVIPFMALVTAYCGELLRKISKKAHLSIAALSAYLNEVLPSILFVKANNAEQCASARFERLAHVDLYKQLEKKKMKALVPQLVQIIYFGALFIFCIGSLVVSSGSFDSSGMVSFIASLVLLIEPIQGVGKAYNELKQGEPAIERLFDMTRFKAQVIENSDAVDLDSVKGDLKFCDISFRYEDNMPLVLNKLDLHIKAGETIALIGPSGGGKTTLVKLLLRLYDPLSGSIVIDNHNIQSIRLESLRRHVGLVSQDTTLFSGTVAENIGHSDIMTKIDMERVEHAAQTAYADEFIRTLPEGYATNIGPRGSMLSGGQRQRLAIARALYQNSSILILDEATSALDSKSEQLVRQALQHLMKDRTVLVIAHRLETVLMAKRVFLLNDGKLEEQSLSSLLGGHHESTVPNQFLI